MTLRRAPVLWMTLLTVGLLTAARSALAPPPLPVPDERFEFRGAWVATVAGLDWPRTATPDSQQAELAALFDGLKAAGINAVFFQVRAEADAFYASPHEPWSYWLTGRQGRAPAPHYDPLAVAVREAHRRGMELHAWFNPFRAVRSRDYPNAPNHVARTHPEWLLRFGDMQMLDPGLPEVRAYVAAVVADVARRYDIDGVHFDDYFYPYPPKAIRDEDARSFRAHGHGAVDRAAWRRANVDHFVCQVADSLHAVRPALKFGISPFGIWKSGIPAGTAGLSAYDVVYADAPRWLAEGWVDYLVPQLYWPFGGRQDFGRLAGWWATVGGGRHLYAGHGLYRADAATYDGPLHDAGELPRQVRYIRRTGFRGSAFFRAQNLMTPGGFVDSLQTTLYRVPALTPPMAWKDRRVPGAPVGLKARAAAPGTVELTWQRPPARSDRPEERRYAVYRLRTSKRIDAARVVADPRNLLAVTGETTLIDPVPVAGQAYVYAVTAVSANSIESAPAGAAPVTPARRRSGR